MTNTQNVIETNTKPCNNMYVAQTSPALEQLVNVNKKRAVRTGTKEKKDAETGKKFMSTTYQYKNIEIETQKQEELEFNEIFSKLHLLALTRLAEHPEQRVIDFKISDLQELFNVKRRNLNKQVKQAVHDLVGLSIRRQCSQDMDSKCCISVAAQQASNLPGLMRALDEENPLHLRRYSSPFHV